MGRFASTVEFYTRYREPYCPEFFRTVAERLALRGGEALLDTGLDPKPAMIEAAKEAAEQAGAPLTLRLGRIEDFPAGELFDIVTIGRALHWLDRGSALEVLERIVSGYGRVLVCWSTSVETPATPWLKPYQEVCRSWSDDPDRQRYRMEPQNWLPVTQIRHVSVADLIGRALSKSNTSPAFLGERKTEFEAEIRSALEPFSQDEKLQEEIVANAMVFGRAAL